MESLRKSFKSHGSYKHTRRISAGGGSKEEHNEEQPILFDHHENHQMKTSNVDSEDLREVVVKIDGNNGSDAIGGGAGDVEVQNNINNGSKIWRESSYQFWKDGNKNNVESHQSDGFYFQRQGIEDPPSKLIGQFLNKQKDSGLISLDMDLEMDELGTNDRSLPPIAEFMASQPNLSKEVRVSFQNPTPNRVEIAPEPIHRRYKESSDEEDHNHNRGSLNFDGGNRGDVLRCTSNASFRPSSSLLRTKTKSRLMDPPEEQYRKSAQLKSGFLGKNNEDDEDDPFTGEDLPEGFRKEKFNTLTIIEWLSLIIITIAFICSLTIPPWVKMTLLELHLWKWELLILVLICGRLLSGWVIRLVVFFIERNFLLRKRVLYFVYGVRKPVQNCLWLGLVLIAWHFMFDKKVEREVSNKALEYVTKVLVCFLVATLIWLVKTLLVKVLASSFHVSTYFDRIQDSLFNQYVIETLSGPPLIEILNTQEDEDKLMAELQKLQNAGVNVPNNFKDTAFSTMKSGRIIGNSGVQRSMKMGKSITYSRAISKKQNEGITIDHLHKLNQKNVSAWNMKRLVNIVRHGVLSTLDEKVSDSTHGDESAMQIRSEFEAKTAARKIFNNVAKPQSKYIYLEDLMCFMRDDEALKTMNLFEGAIENNRVSKSALKNWVIDAFRERRSLSLTLNDTKTAVNKLHQMVNMVVSVVIVVVWLLILGIATTHLLVLISSQILMVVFIFGNTCKMIFEAMIFLFVMHPFDVGDRCEVDGVQMIVEEMNILNTVFLRYDNQKIFYPNSALSILPISNLYRSPDMGDAIEFCIHISTTVEKIAIMKQRITGYIESKKDHWYPSPMVVVKDVEDMNRLKIAVWLTHRMNHQNMGERWARRALLVEEMIKIFRDLDIEYRMLPVDINVRNMPTSTSTRFPSNWTACSD